MNHTKASPVTYVPAKESATHILQKLNPAMRGDRKWEDMKYLHVTTKDAVAVTAFLVATNIITERDVRRSRVRIIHVSQAHVNLVSE